MKIILLTLMQSVLEFVNDSVKPHLKTAYLSWKHKRTLDRFKEDLTKSSHIIATDSAIRLRYLLLPIFMSLFIYPYLKLVMTVVT